MNTQKTQKSSFLKGWSARLYDFCMSMLGFGKLYKKALAMISLQPEDSLLDLGCGTGKLLRMLQKRFGKKVRLVGVEASKDMLNVCRKKSSPDFFLDLFRADAAYLTMFDTGSFDWVVSTLAFHHMPPSDKVRTVQEISRVLKEGGKCLIVDFGSYSSWFGAIMTWFLNRHAFTKGNMAFVETELRRWRLIPEKGEWHQGYIQLLLAKKD